MELNTLQLIQIIKKDQCLKQLFLGIFPKDRIPLRVKYPSCLILNTHSSSQPGEHWLAIYFDQNRHVDFFDSFGRHPSNFGLEKYLDRLSSNWHFNKTQIQSITSSVCGYYCVLFLLYRCRGFSLQEFIKRFSNNAEINDLILLHLLNKEYN